MRQALALAGAALADNEVPVGALVVQEGCVLGAGYNQVIKTCDPSAHAEIVALRAAAKTVNNYRLPAATLYITLEPCVMCAGAIVQARLQRVVFGAHDPRFGAAGTLMNLLQHSGLNHRCDVVTGVLAESCARMLTEFFQERR